MTRSYQTRTVPVDSAALERLENYAVEEGVYETKRDAHDDNYEQIIDHLVEEGDS